MENNLKFEIRNSQVVECLDGSFLCGENSDLIVAYEHLAGFWKTIDLMFSKLTYFFSLSVNVNGLPVEIYAIRESLQIYYSTIEKNRSNVRPVECLVVFMTAFRKIMEKFIHLKLNSSDGSSWDLNTGTPLDCWMKARNTFTCSVNYRKENEIAFERFIIPKNISRILLRESSSLQLSNDQGV